VLVVFEKESTLKTTLERMSTDSFYTYLKKCYLFKTYEDFLKDPMNHWTNLEQQKIHLLNL